jgi:hypothetical protein
LNGKKQQMLRKNGLQIHPVIRINSWVLNIQSIEVVAVFLLLRLGREVVVLSLRTPKGTASRWCVGGVVEVEVASVSVSEVVADRPDHIPTFIFFSQVVERINFVALIHLLQLVEPPNLYRVINGTTASPMYRFPCVTHIHNTLIDNCWFSHPYDTLILLTVTFR